MRNDNEQLPTTITLAIVKIAGIRHYVGSDVFTKFKSGDTLELQLEPSNPYDPKAVKVLWQGGDVGQWPSPLMVGYVPKMLAQAISALIRAGYEISAKITEDRAEHITITLHP